MPIQPSTSREGVPGNLAAQRPSSAIEAALRKGKSYGTSGWVFKRIRGEGPLTMSIVWKAWCKLAERAGAPGSLSRPAAHDRNRHACPGH